jgi:NhaA family Na+:H+ antiporter
MIVIRSFLASGLAGGVLLGVAAALALVFSNSALAPLYDMLLGIPVELRVGPLLLAKPLLLWINDGLMAIFFFLVGLELKREILEGELSTRAQIQLPAAAALGGMAAPALIYAALNWSDPVGLRGWAIPAATDIAFALGVLLLLGSRVPIALRVFLTAVAIIDDLGAIVVIALFYTAELSVESLGVAGACLLALFALNRAGVTRAAPYLLVGLIMWVGVLKSGVHATLAGVALAMFIPLRAVGRDGEAPLKRLEHDLHPWVAFLVLPLFAFANAGVDLAGVELSDWFNPVTLGVALGLILGKQIGVFGAVWLMVRAGWASLPQRVDWLMMYGLATLCGIGFTMSLFIGGLAFDDPQQAVEVRLGVLCGSIVSGLGGWALLRWTLRDRPRPELLAEPEAGAARPRQQEV